MNPLYPNEFFGDLLAHVNASESGNPKSNRSGIIFESGKISSTVNVIKTRRTINGRLPLRVMVEMSSSFPFCNNCS